MVYSRQIFLSMFAYHILNTEDVVFFILFFILISSKIVCNTEISLDPLFMHNKTGHLIQ